MSHPAGKVLALLELLQAHHTLPGPELARRLGVDGRTVRRYADTLAQLGVPVAATRGRYGGYRLQPGYKLPPLMFTEDEGVAVVLGLLAADRLGLATERYAGASALAKLRRVLPAGLAGRIAALEESLGFTLRQPRSPAGAATPVLLALGEAVAGRYRVGLAYRNWRGGRGDRDLDPYGVVFHGGRWYVTGRDHARGQIRTFRLDRIGSVTPRPNTFEVPDGFDPVVQVTQGLASVPYRWQVEVRIAAPPDQVRSAIPPTAGTLRERDGGTRLDCRAENLDGMARMLAGLPWPFTVDAPDELRVALAAHAARLADYAGRR
ncbi:MAG: YafY family transcriptional regulator [Actinobacteria bacterium]|nr:MAG: YafY family transcriptional regulator [Actinomycetota bacterium]